jgi:hypothetical protein
MVFRLHYDLSGAARPGHIYQQADGNRAVMTAQAESRSLIWLLNSCQQQRPA